jgi:tetratricopeptide (TPR) repeat protein
MSTTAEHLEMGRRCQKAGDLDGAERSFAEVVKRNPGRAEGWFLLGGVHQARGRTDEAIVCYRRVIAIDPSAAEAHNSLGIVHVLRGERNEALGCFKRAVQARPSFVHGHNNVGNILKELGRVDEALASYREAVRLKPDFAEVRQNLGDLLRARGQFAEAEAHCREAVRLKPDHADSHNNLGAVLAGLGRFDEAAAAFRDALRLDPGVVHARGNLGWALAQSGNLHDAVIELREAIAAHPDRVELRRNLATALASLGRSQEALAACHEALGLKPGDPDALAILALVLSDLGRYDESLEAYSRVIAHVPDRHEARRNRALIWLLHGELDRGWDEYEWRWGCKGLPPRPFPKPLWNGEPLAGRTIMLHAEQGLGDTIQFIRYARMVRERSGRVVVVAQPTLLPLLASCPDIDELVGQGDPIPAFDVHAPLLSLPRIFGTTLDTIPAGVPYLSAEPSRVERWRQYFESLPGLKIGVAWQGNPKHERDFRRSFGLVRLAAVAAVPDVQLMSLQRGFGEDDVAEFAAVWPVHDPRGRLDEKAAPFLEIAAIIANLDLVIACDSAIAHLAGALGTPVWIALPYCPDWRWFLERTDSPWYPTARLFRQANLDDWDSVFEPMALALREREAVPRNVAARPAAPRPTTGPVMVEISVGELIDKITILEIKNARISDPNKLQNIRKELEILAAARDGMVPLSSVLGTLVDELRAVNEALWDIEDEIRICEHRQDFRERFIELARSVYRTNDRRAELKRAINDELGSRLVEEKSYQGGGP